MQWPAEVIEKIHYDVRTAIQAKHGWKIKDRMGWNKVHDQIVRMQGLHVECSTHFLNGNDHTTFDPSKDYWETPYTPRNGIYCDTCGEKIKEVVFTTLDGVDVKDLFGIGRCHTVCSTCGPRYEYMTW